jgi:hypothetical protein
MDPCNVNLIFNDASCEVQMDDDLVVLEELVVMDEDDDALSVKVSNMNHCTTIPMDVPTMDYLQG